VVLGGFGLRQGTDRAPCVEGVHDGFDDCFDGTAGDELPPAELNARKVALHGEFVDKVIGHAKQFGRLCHRQEEFGHSFIRSSGTQHVGCAHNVKSRGLFAPDQLRLAGECCAGFSLVEEQVMFIKGRLILVVV
jgi:hypothetical protein